MNHRLAALRILLIVVLGCVLVVPARAASLQQVSGWNGGTSFPSDVSMYAYVPDKVATNPPILTLIHYCGGTASAVFGQAGTIVKAADQYGFIIVAPSSGRCWDVTSTKTHTRNGGGDSHAIAQMVRYALSKYSANADRVYSTGDSSGAMMTELLLALYPDIYKAGSTFAGVPAGCSNEFDGSGLCGLPAQTAQQWGDRVRAMYAGYSGHRPRVQLFHGDADGTITYKNQAEAIKEWTNVLGLDTNPTSTDTGLTLGSHQATRQRWKNACGYVVLEAWTSIGGDHGPSDCLFNSNVVPFLGLDKTGAVDPEIAACSGDAGAGGTGGSGGTGGNSGTGGTTAGGGTSGARDAGPDAARDTGNGGAGGGGGTGGTTANGGSGGGGGASGSGGNAGSGGSSTSGGTQGSGGRQGTGGNTISSGGGSSGGSPGTGGSQGTGGATGSGGGAGSGGSSTTSSSGGSTGSGSGGSSSGSGAGGSVGSGGKAGGGGSAANGCSCALGAASNTHGFWQTAMFALALAALVHRRRRRS
jgi:acetylxylan esterase